MTKFDITNPVYSLALSFINNTDKHIFLTGKAGTGKTTFLRHIRERTYKKSIIAAPTGVSAINAGGVTIHTLFNLPLKPYIPTNKAFLEAIGFNAAKRLLLCELELLILDEVSMLRADTLDAIDAILRKLRSQPIEPFGGVQVVYIGDLMQLSPIATTLDWEQLKQHYLSPFCIDAFAFAETQPICLTLEKIYRQKEESFISLLNAVRLGQNDGKTLEELNRFYRTENKAEMDAAVVITTHNQRAEEINTSRLCALPGDIHYLDAHIVGNFSQRSYPTDKILPLKVGAQVMLVRNDKGLQKKYFNGKIGIVEEIEEDSINVRFSDGELLQIENETWKQIDYRYQQDGDDILEEELGSFQQFPIRLAWAITVHKSQGLTFDKAAIDAADAFLPGQVYVALSRLSSKEGLQLLSVIPPKAIKAHPRIVAFSKDFLTWQEAEKLLDDAKHLYVGKTIAKCFSFSKIEASFALLVKQYADETFVLSHEEVVQELNRHTKAFVCEILDLFRDVSSNNKAIFAERIEKAVTYFTDKVDNAVVNPLRAELEKRKGFTLQKKLTQALGQLLTLCEQKKKELALARNLANTLSTNREFQELLFSERKRFREKQAKELQKKLPSSKTKDSTDYSISLQFFREGKTVAQIAGIRKLSTNAIEYQLASFLPTGDIKIEQLVERQLLERIVSVLEAEQGVPLAVLKAKLPGCSYGQLYAAQLYWKSGAKVPYTPHHQ